MSWEKASYASTVLQLFVVVVSVILIWKQLKKQGEQLQQQTDLALVANTQALVALVSPFNLEMAQNPEMAKLWIMGQKEWEALPVEKKQQYESMLRWWFIFYENIFFQAERDLLDQSIFDAWKKDIDVFVEEQLVENHWTNLSKKYHRQFVDYLDTRVNEKRSKQMANLVMQSD